MKHWTKRGRIWSTINNCQSNEEEEFDQRKSPIRMDRPVVKINSQKADLTTNCEGKPFQNWILSTSGGGESLKANLITNGV